MADRVLLLLTDRDLNVVGDPIGAWTDINAVRRFNAPGSGVFAAPATTAVLDFLWSTAPPQGWLLDYIDPGNRVVLVVDDAVWSAGPIESWAFNDPGDGPAVQVAWAEDSAWFGARLTYPTPTVDAESQTAVNRWAMTGNAEDVMRALVNVNAGPGALAARRVPQLVLGADNGVGTSVQWGTRLQVLSDDLRSVATIGGGLGWRTTQVGNQIEFQVYQPQDLTDSVRFSRGLGNLRAVKLSVAAPTVTAAIVAGSGEGTSRVIFEENDTTATTDWGRYEQLVDQRQTSNSTELTQAGTEALAEGAPRARLETETVDTTTQAYGTHYDVGDLVSVEVWPGREVAGLVGQVALAATPGDGVRFTPQIGAQDDITAPDWVRHLRELDRRLGRLEAI